MNQEQLNFIKSQKLLHLATISSKGTPHITPVWYLYENDRIYVGTNLRTQKVKNILGNNKVSFSIDQGIHSPIYGVMGVGIASIIQKKENLIPIAKKILLRYFKTLTDGSAKELLLDTDCIIEISFKKILSWEF